MGKILHQKSIDTIEAVAYLSHRVHHILRNGGTEDNILCDLCHNGSWTAVTSGYIIYIARTAYKSLKIQEKRIYPNMIGAHYLQTD